MTKYITFNIIMGLFMVGCAAAGAIYATSSDTKSDGTMWAAYAVAALPFGMKWVIDGIRQVKSDA